MAATPVPIALEFACAVAVCAAFVPTAFAVAKALVTVASTVALEVGVVVAAAVVVNVGLRVGVDVWVGLGVNEAVKVNVGDGVNVFVSGIN